VSDACFAGGSWAPPQPGKLIGEENEMTDASWESFDTDDALVSPEVVADVAPLVDAAVTDDWQGDLAASWGDYNAEIGEAAAADVATELAYAADLQASGFSGAAEAALGRAEIAAGTAEDHFDAAADDYDAAAYEYGAAADNLELAAGYVEDAGVYDTSSYDTSSYDAGFDTTSFDTGVADAGFDTGSGSDDDGV
jgi:hypothetical protein